MAKAETICEFCGVPVPEDGPYWLCFLPSWNEGNRYRWTGSDTKEMIGRVCDNCGETIKKANADE